MKNRINKPKLTAKELVAKMRDEKGITFGYVSEDEAVEYLQNINNYLRVASYRKNFPKYNNGKNKGKYIRLDFGYMKELAVLDMCLRDILSKMCLDVEHFMKTKMLYDIEQDSTCDGYAIVKNFLDNNQGILNSLAHQAGTPFVGELVSKYFAVSHTIPKTITAYDDCPVWVLTEMIPYGGFLRFYEYYYGENAPIAKNLLDIIRKLRNGVAHNNCIIADLHPKSSTPPAEIKEAVKAIRTISRSQRQKKLTSRPILEFVTLLYVYRKVIGRDVIRHRLSELENLFFVKMLKRQVYFEKNDLLITSYIFVCKIIKHFMH